MNTPEQTVVAWLKHANVWLNIGYESGLSDPAKLLLNKLNHVHKNQSKSALDIIRDLKRLSDKPSVESEEKEFAEIRPESEEKEFAEIRLECGLVAAEMGNFRDALEMFQEAYLKYTKFHHQ